MSQVDSLTAGRPLRVCGIGIASRRFLRRSRIATLLIACAGHLGPTAAEARTMQQKLEAACAADIQKLCPQAAQDADALKACMLGKRSQVSEPCIKLIDASE